MFLQPVCLIRGVSCRHFVVSLRRYITRHRRTSLPNCLRTVGLSNHISCSGEAIRRTKFHMNMINNKLVNFKNFSSVVDVSQRPFVIPEIAMSRVVTAEDIQMMGFCHGGRTLQWIEDAGDIIANQYCNSFSHESSDEEFPASESVLVSIERVEFFNTLDLYDVVEFTGQVVATTKHSLNIHLNIHTENTFTGERKHANVVSLWYVATSVDDASVVVRVPRLEAEGQNSLITDKRNLIRQCSIAWPKTDHDGELHTVAQSQGATTYFLHPVHCGPRRKCRAGPMLMWLDEFAGIVGARYFRYPAVTVSADSINFLSSITVVSYLEFTAFPVYTSKRVLDVQILADMHYVDGGKFSRKRIVEAFFTYVGYNPNNSPVIIPPLKLRTDGERNRFEQRKLLHETWKKMRKER